MCGIAGIFNHDGRPVSETELRRLTDQIRHRGPDGAGYYVQGPVGLGHRRLAIIDLATGAQPLGNEDGSVQITFNGEIYNFQELRPELERLGHRFRTHSDTEVIVHAWEAWGERCVERLRGMFVFAIWDSNTRTLFLARDRLGIKPLYYWQTSERTCFASELQAFHQLEPRPRKLDLQALDFYLELQYVPAPHTIFQEVRKLSPGCTLTIQANGQTRQRCYWQLGFQPEAGVTERDWLDRLDAKLEEAVRLHLIADVPVGAFLSGGVDSPTVVAYMSRLLDKPARTFSIGFPDPHADEAPRARELAALLHTDHHEEYVQPDGFAMLPMFARHYGEPFADSSAVPTFVVCGMARKQVTVALSGDGGDEAFAGYSWLKALLREFEIPASSLQARTRQAVRRGLGALGVWKEKTDPLRLYEQARCIFGLRERQQLWRTEFAARAGDRLGVVEQHREELEGLDLCSQIQLLDYRWYLPHDLLAKVDIASMFHSLEVRVPLLDHEVVELAARMPAELKIRQVAHGAEDDLVTKYALRQVAARRLPAIAASPRKLGFALPLKSWIGSLSPEALTAGLLEESAGLTRIFRPEAIRAATRAANTGGRQDARLWSLLVLAAWFREHPWVEVESGGRP